MVEIQLARGVKDWYGSDAMLRNKIRDTLRDVFETYGFEPIETPPIERRQVLGFKGGGEIQKEVFQLNDQGERDLALRFDQTVPFARFLAVNSDVPLPFKRYVIGEVFRDGPTQPEQGRYRVFTQCDVDIAGVAGMSAEAELLSLADTAFKNLGIGGVEVMVNNRKVLNGILDYAGVPQELASRAIVSLDKLDKIGLEGVVGELEQLNNNGKSLNNQSISTLMESVSYTGTNVEKHAYLTERLTSEQAVEGLREVSEVIQYSQASGLSYVTFDPSLARGLDYYTGTTMEVYPVDRSIINSAILAGGRFDDMVGDFQTSEEQKEKGETKIIPAVGFSFGLERMAMLVSAVNPETRQTPVDIYIIPMDSDQVGHSLSTAQILRQNGLNVDIALEPYRRLREGIAYADKKGMPYVGILGSNEVENKTLSVRNVTTNDRFELPVMNINHETLGL